MNKAFNTYLPVRLMFGEGRINEIGTQASQFGKVAMLVTVPWNNTQGKVFSEVKALLEASGIRVVVHDKVVPNPTTTCINEGVEIAKKEGIQMLIGLGGGSSIDAAKAIAVGATHPGVPWDYVYTNEARPDKEKTLPIIAIPTTSGTGSHMTKYSVFTNPDVQIKSTIVDETVFPRLAIVDPELMITMSAYVTATTGFDAFTHAFESFTNINANPLIDLLALESIATIVHNLPKAVENPQDKDARCAMAYADTLAGISIANVGTTLPHSMGQPISGKFPHVAHGQSLAVVYPEFMKLTYPTCVKKFAKVARLFNFELTNVSDEDAAAASVEEIIRFQKKIGIYTTLNKLGVTEDKIEGIIADTMACPDTYVTTAIPTEDQVRQMFKNIR